MCETFIVRGSPRNEGFSLYKGNNAIHLQETDMGAETKLGKEREVILQPRYALIAAGTMGTGRRIFLRKGIMYKGELS